MLKNHHFLILSLHFTIIYAFEVIYYIHKVEILYNNVIRYITVYSDSTFSPVTLGA